MDALRVIIHTNDNYSPESEYAHKYGGSPTFMDELPLCDVCKVPLTLIFQFDLADPKLSFLQLEKLKYLPILSCISCDLSYVGQLMYRFDNTSIQVLSSDAVQSFGDFSEDCPERKITLEPIPSDQLLEDYSSYEEWQKHMSKIDIPKHQLGGNPYWVQNDVHLSCPECGAEMRFLGQVDSHVWFTDEPLMAFGHEFGDMGILYIHYCDNCNILSTGADCY